MKKERLPYVYYVKNLTTQMKYIGVRYSKKCHPDDFWVDYFTSSNVIKKLIEIYGKDDFECKVLKSFSDEHDAIKYERHLLKIAINRDDYLNISCNFLVDNKDQYYVNKEKKKQILAVYGKLQSVQKLGFFGFSEEKRFEICSMGGKAAADINKKNGTAIFDPEVRKRQHKTLKEKQISAFYDPALRKKLSSMGGKNGAFSKSYCEKNGITEEDRIKAQAERGKRGGSKNKGFIWYTDGVNEFKYTKTQQEQMCFEKFLEKNKQFKKGKLKNKTIGYVFANDGIKQYMVSEEDIEKLGLIKGRINKTNKQ